MAAEGDEITVLQSDRFARALTFLTLALSILAIILSVQAISKVNRLEEKKVDLPGKSNQELVPQQQNGAGTAPETTPNNSGGR